MGALLITAGPTHEPIDTVRYIANRSSGKLGVALAEAGRRAGWGVTLLMGPSPVSLPVGTRTLRFTTTGELAGLLDDHFDGCDVLIMAAAVADYRPVRSTEPKIARGEQNLCIELEPTPDLVAACARRKRPDQRVIGFALEEPAAVEARAAEKLRRKGLDAIVANPLHTMTADDIDAKLLLADGRRLEPGTMPKPAFAAWLIAQLGLLR